MIKKTISILTATRAEYGLLKPIIKKLKEVEEFDIKIVATGMHLSQEFGLTYKEIEDDGFIIDEKIEILMSSDTNSAVSKSMGMAMISFADYFKKVKPDLLIILGDRYESLAVAIVALNQKIKIAHIHGGEITKGAIDDSIRHAITKLSHIHFTSTNEYKNRVIQLGEEPKNVYLVGASGVENSIKEELISKEELEKSINYNLGKSYGVVTYHPVTLGTNEAKDEIINLMDALVSIENMKFIITKANADAGGRIINKTILEYQEKYKNIILVDSLGLKRYLTALKYSDMVIGNSSSGLLEAPSFKIPTINIGKRQEGRIQAKSIINCNCKKEDILNAIKKASTKEFKESLKDIKNPYGVGNTSSKIRDILIDRLKKDDIKLAKDFYDCEVK